MAINWTTYDFGATIHSINAIGSEMVVLLTGTVFDEELGFNVAVAVGGEETWVITESNLLVSEVYNTNDTQVFKLGTTYYITHVPLGGAEKTITHSSTDLETWTPVGTEIVAPEGGHTHFVTPPVFKDGTIYFFYSDYYSTFCDLRLATTTDLSSFSDSLLLAGIDGEVNVIDYSNIAINEIFIEYTINFVPFVYKYDGTLVPQSSDLVDDFPLSSVGASTYLSASLTSIESSPDLSMWNSESQTGTNLTSLGNFVYGVSGTGTLLIGEVSSQTTIPGKELYYNTTGTGLIRIEIDTEISGNGLFIPMSDGAYRVVKRGDQLGTIKIGSDSLSEIV